MKNQKEIYNGQKNPYRYNSKDYHEFSEQRDWWMNNLNPHIIIDYMIHMDFYMRRLETENQLLSEKLTEIVTK